MGRRCCCGSCYIIQENFNTPAAESTTLPGWLEISGDWLKKALGGYWAAQITGDGEIECTTFFHYEIPACYVRAKLLNCAANSKVQLIVEGNYTVMAKYFFESTKSTVSIYREGTLLQSNDSYASWVGGTPTMGFWIGPFNSDDDCDKMNLAAGIPEDTCAVWDTIDSINSPFTLSVKTVGGGSIVYNFDYVYWMKQMQMDPDCPECDCFFVDAYGNYTLIERTLTATVVSGCPVYDGTIFTLSAAVVGAGACRAWQPGSLEQPCGYYAYSPGLMMIKETPNDLDSFRLSNLGTGGVRTWTDAFCNVADSTLCPLHLEFGPFLCSKVGEPDCGTSTYTIVITE